MQKQHDLWAREPPLKLLPQPPQTLGVGLLEEEQMGNIQRKYKNQETNTFTRAPVLVGKEESPKPLH